MRNKSLKETNPYLGDPEIRERGLWSTVSSSSAIEGVRVAKEKVTMTSSVTVTSPHKPAESGKSPR
jgi:hypothetical protein